LDSEGKEPNLKRKKVYFASSSDKKTFKLKFLYPDGPPQKPKREKWGVGGLCIHENRDNVGINSKPIPSSG